MLSLLATVVFVGLIFYLVEKYLPLAEPFRLVERIVGVVICAVLLLKLLHLLGVGLAL